MAVAPASARFIAAASKQASACLPGAALPAPQSKPRTLPRRRRCTPGCARSGAAAASCLPPQLRARAAALPGRRRIPPSPQPLQLQQPVVAARKLGMQRGRRRRRQRPASLLRGRLKALLPQAAAPVAEIHLHAAAACMPWSQQQQLLQTASASSSAGKQTSLQLLLCTPACVVPPAPPSCPAAPHGSQGHTAGRHPQSRQTGPPPAVPAAAAAAVALAAQRQQPQQPRRCRLAVQPPRQRGRAAPAPTRPT